MNNATWLAVALGVVAGGIAGAIVLRKVRPVDETEVRNTTSLDELVSNQLICDALDMGNVTAWFRENAGSLGANAVFFLAKPTKKMAEMFAITGDITQMNQDHNLIQAVVNRKKKLPVAVRLVSYGTKPDLIAEHLQDKDYMIITND